MWGHILQKTDSCQKIVAVTSLAGVAQENQFAVAVARSQFVVVGESKKMAAGDSLDIVVWILCQDWAPNRCSAGNTQDWN
jgi:hypothetical protein